MHGHTEVVDGMRIDRYSRAACVEWDFSTGAQFTVAAFYGPLGQEKADAGGGNDFKGMAGVKGGIMFPEHANPYFLYNGRDNLSHYTAMVSIAWC